MRRALPWCLPGTGTSATEFINISSKWRFTSPLPYRRRVSPWSRRTRAINDRRNSPPLKDCQRRFIRYAYQFHRRDRRRSVVVHSIGRIKAATAWHASGAKPESGDWKTIALRELIRKAEDFEADAIIGVDYEVDGVQSSDLAPVSLCSASPRPASP